MTRSQIWISLAITLALFAAPAVADDVVELTPENFDKEVGKDRGALVEFFAPWFVFLNYTISLTIHRIKLICSCFGGIGTVPGPIYNSISLSCYEHFGA
jgi:hypothetical protein